MSVCVTFTVEDTGPEEPVIGDTKCIGYDLYQYNGTMWVLLEENNVSQCNYPGTSGDCSENEINIPYFGCVNKYAAASVGLIAAIILLGR